MELHSVVALTFARQPEGHGPDHAITRSGHQYDNLRSDVVFHYPMDIDEIA